MDYCAAILIACCILSVLKPNILQPIQKQLLHSHRLVLRKIIFYALIGWIEQNTYLNTKKKEIKMSINPIFMSFPELTKKNIDELKVNC